MTNFLNDPKICISNSSNFILENHPTNYRAGMADEKDAEDKLEKNVKRISKYQEQLYAQGKQSLLIIFQAMDAAGKDSTIENVMKGINPQGCHITSFKQPSKEELAHDFLWRCNKAIPEKGRIGIFNRSYYEEVLVCKVHENHILGQQIEGINSVEDINETFWQGRYDSINNFEKHLNKNGCRVVKFFLNVSKEEQKIRFLDRINNAEKNWKFSYGDIEERKLWDKYMAAYSAMITNTTNEINPWYIIPADNKWFMQYCVSEILKDTLKSLNPTFPILADNQMSLLSKAIIDLQNE